MNWLISQFSTLETRINVLTLNCMPKQSMCKNYTEYIFFASNLTWSSEESVYRNSLIEGQPMEFEENQKY